MATGETKRSLARHPAVAEMCMVAGIGSDTALVEFLEELAMTHRLHWLLAHLDDGVLWGRFEKDQLITSYDAAAGNPTAERYCPPLRTVTLQQARLFAPHAEVMLWRNDENAWQARLIRDARDTEKADWEECFDESQWLWGTYAHPLGHGFSLLEHGEQGLRHAVPCSLSGDIAPPRLLVRHYLTPQGLAQVDASRLCNLIVAE